MRFNLLVSLLLLSAGCAAQTKPNPSVMQVQKVDPKSPPPPRRIHDLAQSYIGDYLHRITVNPDSISKVRCVIAIEESDKPYCLAIRADGTLDLDGETSDHWLELLVGSVMHNMLQYDDAEEKERKHDATK